MRSGDHNLILSHRGELVRGGGAVHPILSEIAGDLVARSKKKGELTKTKRELADDAPVRFQCPVLEEHLRGILEKPEGSITRRDMMEVKEYKKMHLWWYPSIECLFQERCPFVRGSSNRKSCVSSLVGLETVSNLESLTIEFEGGDLKPLSKLNNLKSLELICKSNARNDLTNLSPISKAKRLEVLFLHGSGVRDLSPLSTLGNLKYLYLGGNKISDLSPLVNLANLEMLELQGNPIGDFSPLTRLKKLEKLHIGESQISNPGERTPGNRTRERRHRRRPDLEYKELERERQELLEKSPQAVVLRKALPNCKIVLDQMFWEHEHAQ
jgi:hypothetical protein